MGKRGKQHRINSNDPPGNAPSHLSVFQAPWEETFKLFRHSIWLFQNPSYICPVPRKRREDKLFKWSIQ